MEGLGKTIVLIVLALAISHSLFLVILSLHPIERSERELRDFTGKASGIVSFCINTPPSINISNCSTNATQGEYYSCWVDTTDPDQISITHTSTFASITRSFSNLNSSFFNISPDGHINFTPTNDDVGNFTIEIAANDGGSCSNSLNYLFFDLQVININDPPYLIEDIPDQNYQKSIALHAFYLNNYFRDPDHDPLAYVVGGNTQISVTITNDSEVTIYSDVCDITEVVLFTAIDPYNATNTSNPVLLRCISEPTPDEGSDGQGTGGGGGGGTTRICKPEYECYDYYKCRENNTKVQNCVDTKGCGGEDRLITVPCLYEWPKFCNESWSCSEWNNCLPNGTQKRNCTDSNQCGTSVLMPNLTQACEYIGTCEDGILNCHDGSCEENIDCGGPCGSCKSIETPYPFKEERGIGIYIVTGIVLLLLSAALVYHYFRKEINEALARAGWLLSRKKKKQILLSPDDKKKLLANISDIEKKISKYELPDLMNRQFELLRFYLVKACSPKLKPEFDHNNLIEALGKNNKKIGTDLKRVFISVYASEKGLLSDEKAINETFLRQFIEELRNLVLQTSVTTQDDAAREIKEHKPKEKADDIEKMLIRITNIYIALEFLEVNIAKKKYIELLAEYDKLIQADRELLFEHITRLYNSISYVHSWAKPSQ